MVLLTILRVLAALAILSFLVFVLPEKAQGNLVYVPYVLMAIFQIFYMFYHPLVGVICLVAIGLFTLYIFCTQNRDELKYGLEKVLVYLCVMVFSVSGFVELLETCLGRLF